jgi:hypothetical protein
MTIRARIVATLDVLNLDHDSDRTAVQTALTAEVESNPSGRRTAHLRSKTREAANRLEVGITKRVYSFCGEDDDLPKIITKFG